ncbi:MAG: Holliday junction resolvase RuvX [bacterium]
MHEIRGRILGLDYGKKRIGVAVSDPMCIIARGLPTIVYKNLPAAINKIEKIISDYHIREVVVGYPLTLKGEVNITTTKAKNFVQDLKKRIALPIVIWDERFTSILAERALKEMGQSPSMDKAKIDQLSASFILQSYLDQIHLTNQT